MKHWSKPLDRESKLKALEKLNVVHVKSDASNEGGNNGNGDSSDIKSTTEEEDNGMCCLSKGVINVFLCPTRSISAPK